MPWPTRFWALAGSLLMRSFAATWPSRSRFTASGWSLRNAVRTMSWVVTYWPFGHRSLSSTRTLPPPSWTSRVAHGSGTQAPSSWPCLNRSRVWALSCGTIETSPPPAGSVLRPFFFSQVRSATSWVLPSCGDATVLPFRSSALLMLGLDDQERAARRRARDDPDRLAVRLRVRVDRRVRPDVGGVERAREQRLDRRGAGVERARLELTLLPSFCCEDAALDADDRRRVGDVGEVAEPQRDVALRGAARRRRRARSSGGTARCRRRWFRERGRVTGRETL